MKNIVLIFLCIFLQVQMCESAEKIMETSYFKRERLIVDHKVVDEKIIEIPLRALPSNADWTKRPFLGCNYDIVNLQSDEEGRGFWADKVSITCSGKAPIIFTGHDTSIFAGDTRFEIKGKSRKWGIVFSIQDSAATPICLLRNDGTYQIIRVPFFPTTAVGLIPQGSQPSGVFSQGRQVWLLKLPIIKDDSIQLRISSDGIGGKEKLLIIMENGEWEVIE